MRTTTVLRRFAAGFVAVALVTAVTNGGPASAADGFSVDDFAGNAMGTRELVPGNNTCSPTGNSSLTMGTGTMRVNINVPDTIGCNYANAEVRWTAPTSVNIEQNGADRIILKYRDVLPNQPSAVTFGLNLVDVNGRTATVGGLTRNGGAAGDWLTIRYTPEYVGDVSVLNFQSGFDRANVKSVTLLIAATTNNQNVSVTFEGIGTNVGEPSYEAPSFGSASVYDFPALTATTKTFTVTGNPAPDVTWTGKPSWMTISTSATAGGRLVTMTGNPGTAYSDTSIAFHADVANSLTADASVRIVVPSPVTVTPNTTNTLVGVAGPVIVGTATAIPSPTFVNGATGVPAGTALSLSGTNIVLTGTPTTAGTYNVSATVGNEFRTAPFARTVIVGKVPVIDPISSKSFLRGTPIASMNATSSGYPAPTTVVTNLPAGLSSSGGVIFGTPTTNGTTTVTVTSTNSFGSDVETFTVAVGDAPTVAAPVDFEVLAGFPVSTPVTISGAPTTFTATGLPAGLSAELVGGAARIVGTPTRPANSGAASGTAQLTVTNAFGSDTEPMPWVVNAVPRITGTTFASTTVGSALAPVEITIDGFPAPTVTITDPYNDGTLLPPGITVDQSVAGVVTVSGTPTAPGTELIRITASNSSGGGITHDLTISARTVPVFADASPTLTVLSGESETLSLGWSGHPTATLTLASTLPPWLSFEPSTGTFTASPSPFVDGVFGPFQVDATNAAGTASAQVLVRVTSPSVLSAVSDVTVAQGASVTQALGTVSGFPTPAVTATGLPDGLTLTQTGADYGLSGTPSAAGGEYDVTLSASNGIGVDDEQDFTVTVTTPATISAPATATLPVGQAASLSATLGGFPLPTVVATGLPAGLSIDGATGAITGTPTAPGTYTVTLSTVGGTAPAPAPVDLVITVTAVPDFVSEPSARTVRLGEAVASVEFAIAGYPMPTVSATGLPAGLGLVESGGDVTLEGTPTETGVFTVTVTLTSSAGTAEREWTVTVEDPAQVSVASTATVDLGEAITDIHVTTNGFPAPTVTAAGLPAGLELVSDIAGTRITGTPTEDGQFSVLLTATNGVGTAASATIVLDVYSLPSVGGDREETFLANLAANLILPVSGYPTPTLTVSGLPGWLSFDGATGTFSGTPAVSDGGAGTVVTVTATSAAGVVDTQVTFGVSSPPAVTTSGGTLTVRSGDAVDDGLTEVTGFPTPTVTATGLPAGLAVDLVGDVLTLSGTTTDEGSHAATITLSNGVGTDLVVPWTVIVEEPAAVGPLADETITLGDALDLPVNVTGFPVPTVTVTGLPDGLTWEPGAGGGSIGGSPSASGVSTISVSASNGIGDDAEQTFTLTVELPVIAITLGASTVAAGQFVDISATGFVPGEQVTITMFSTPVRLATLHADATGALDVQVRVPANTPAGGHTLVVEGQSGASGSAPITVTAAADELSGTGVDAGGLVSLALLLLVAGAGVLAMVRRGDARRA